MSVNPQPCCSSTDQNEDEPPVTRFYMQNALRQHYYNNSWIVKQMSIEKVLSFGQHLSADVYRVRIHAIAKNESNVWQKHVKSMIVKKPLRDYINTPPQIFKSESVVYNSVWPALNEAFSQQIPLIRPIKAEQTVVVTEDFLDGDWLIPPRRQMLTKVQLKHTFKALAVLHAASIVLIETKKDFMNMFAPYVQDQVFCESNAEVCQNTVADAYFVARYFADEYIPRATPEEFAVIKKFFGETSAAELYNNAKKVTEETDPFSKLFVHGECWSNNFMVKPPGTVFTLFTNIGTVCLESPARDFVYILATNPQTEARKIKLLKKYHRHMMKVLALHVNLNMQSPFIKQFNMEFYQTEINRLRPVALLAGIWLLIPLSSITFAPLSEFNSYNREDKPKLLEKHIDKEFYIRRLVDLLLQYVPEPPPIVVVPESELASRSTDPYKSSEDSDDESKPKKTDATTSTSASTSTVASTSTGATTSTTDALTSTGASTSTDATTSTGATTSTDATKSLDTTTSTDATKSLGETKSSDDSEDDHRPIKKPRK